MLRALSDHMPEGVIWTKPEGGMFLWLTLPETMNSAELLKHALAEGIAFVPGAAFYPADRKRNTLRLNFTACDPDTINTGIARLARLIA
jgi:DNA-binding transcriptional MocR family regulator